MFILGIWIDAHCPILPPLKVIREDAHIMAGEKPAHPGKLGPTGKL